MTSSQPIATAFKNKLLEEILMKTTKNYETRTKKECRECGCEIKEQNQSIIYECERCMCNKEE